MAGLRLRFDCLALPVPLSAVVYNPGTCGDPVEEIAWLEFFSLLNAIVRVAVVDQPAFPHWL